MILLVEDTQEMIVPEYCNTTVDNEFLTAKELLITGV